MTAADLLACPCGGSHDLRAHVAQLIGEHTGRVDDDDRPEPCALNCADELLSLINRRAADTQLRERDEEIARLRALIAAAADALIPRAADEEKG